MPCKTSTPFRTFLRNVSISTKTTYFIAGFAIAAWAPLVPYAKMRGGLDDASLGALLLCLGLGSMVLMPMTGWLTSKFGCRKVISCLIILACITLPLLAWLETPLWLACTLCFFGAAAGGLDVAACIQAIMLQNAMRKQLMPVMLAFYSIGSITSPAIVSLLLSLGVSPLGATGCIVLIILGLFLSTQHMLAPKQEASSDNEKSVVFPRGMVLLLCGMCFSVFLVEGAMMDWGSLFLTTYKGIDYAYAGLGFALFSAALAIGRLAGVRLIAMVGGEKPLVLAGCLVSCLGFVITLFFLPGKSAMLGFFLIGLGNANVIPLLFAATGRQKIMPTAAAISAVTTAGYSGILLGPAFIGFFAHSTSLFLSFCLIGALMLVVAVLASRIYVR